MELLMSLFVAWLVITVIGSGLVYMDYLREQSMMPDAFIEGDETDGRF